MLNCFVLVSIINFYHSIRNVLFRPFDICIDITLKCIHISPTTTRRARQTSCQADNARQRHANKRTSGLNERGAWRTRTWVGMVVASSGDFPAPCNFAWFI